MFFFFLLQDVLLVPLILYDPVCPVDTSPGEQVVPTILLGCTL